MHLNWAWGPMSLKKKVRAWTPLCRVAASAGRKGPRSACGYGSSATAKNPARAGLVCSWSGCDASQPLCICVAGDGTSTLVDDVTSLHSTQTKGSSKTASSNKSKHPNDAGIVKSASVSASTCKVGRVTVGRNHAEAGRMRALRCAATASGAAFHSVLAFLCRVPMFVHARRNWRRTS